MMRCQCIICQELFENNDEQVISALDCGHTFHNACLNQWLENGRTCPSCRAPVNRKKIIPRLFFDAPEDVDETVDSAHLQNQLDTLRLEIRSKDKEKNDAVQEKVVVSERLEAAERARAAVDRRLKEEQNTNVTHLKNLRYYESQQQSLDAERQECRRIKQRLVTMQGLDTLLNGTESETADLISSVGESSSAVQTLARQVAFLKREYEKQKLEKRQMKEEFHRIQMNDIQKTNKLSEQTKQCQVLQDQLERSEGDLKISEKEVECVKRKNSKLQSRLKQAQENKHREKLNSSDILNETTNFKKFSSNTPKLDIPRTNGSDCVDLNLTPDLFDTPKKVKDPDEDQGPTNFNSGSCTSSSNTAILKSLKRPCDVQDSSSGVKIKSLKITSAAETSSQSMKRLTSNSGGLDEGRVKDPNGIVSLASMNIFKKRGLAERVQDYNSITRKGYDGMGGHGTFINSQKNSQTNLFKKPVIKKAKPKSSKLPALPTLKGFGFIRIDDD